MRSLKDVVDDTASRTGFSGVVRVDRAGTTELSRAYGLADRAHRVPNTVETQFAVASGSKTLTALAVMGLVERGILELGTTARSLLGDDLPLIADDVTIEHLLSHRSGIGDYFDDDGDVSDYLLPVPPARLVSPEDYLPILDGYPTVFPAGTDFLYCNGAFVVLALLAQRASGVPFHDLVRQRVFEPAGLTATDYLRSDDLPGDAAIGWVEMNGAWRTNVHHLPVIGGGDGGAYTTTADMLRLWKAFFAGRIVPLELVSEMVKVRSTQEDDDSYGLGLWLDPHTDAVELEGYDPGISFRSVHQPSRQVTWTIISNWSDGAWPLADRMAHLLGTSGLDG